MTAKAIVNKEGLTFVEWLGAADPLAYNLSLKGHSQPGVSYKQAKKRGLEKHFIAWKAGEDPTEWRASCA